MKIYLGLESTFSLRVENEAYISCLFGSNPTFRIPQQEKFKSTL